MRGAALNAHDDHRIAMALSVQPCVRRAKRRFAGVECASISFPQFYKYLQLATR